MTLHIAPFKRRGYYWPDIVITIHGRGFNCLAGFHIEIWPDFYHPFRVYRKVEK